MELKNCYPDCCQGKSNNQNTIYHTNFKNIYARFHVFFLSVLIFRKVENADKQYDIIICFIRRESRYVDLTI